MQRKEALDMLVARTPSGGEALSPDDVAHLLGFTEKEISMMRIYMQADFNTSLVYLSDYIICKYLTREKGKDRFRHFYDQILTRDRVLGEDYFDVKSNHPLVEAALSCSVDEEELISLNLASYARRAPNKKYYLVTGDCFKDLLLLANTDEGKEHRKYYRRLEEVLSILIQYMSELSLRRSVEDTIPCTSLPSGTRH